MLDKKHLSLEIASNTNCEAAITLHVRMGAEFTQVSLLLLRPR